MKTRTLPFLIAGLMAFATFLPALHADDDGDLSKEQVQALVDDVRHPPIADCWSILTGKVRHSGPSAKASGTYPLQVRARFSPKRSLAQVIFNNQERYLIGQNFGDGIQGTSVIEQQGPKEGVVSLQDVGVRPSDITLSFLYWKYEKDLGDDSYKTMACRVLQFHHPDQDEYVQVWVSLKHRFPLLVKWYQGKNTEPYRQLDLKDLKQVHGVYMISRVVISNPGWKTEIRFNDIKLEQLKEKEVVPPDLFLGQDGGAPAMEAPAKDDTAPAKDEAPAKDDAAPAPAEDGSAK